MAYNERLADEMRERLAQVGGEVTEKWMFSGLAFMVDGNLTVAASRRGGILVRTDPADALATEADLDAWLTRALAFVVTLPPK